MEINKERRRAIVESFSSEKLFYVRVSAQNKYLLQGINRRLKKLKESMYTVSIDLKWNWAGETVERVTYKGTDTIKEWYFSTGEIYASIFE